jgi:hypothetical protein
MIRTYVWIPRLKQGGSVGSSGIGWGHASIEVVDGSYISKWPKREDTPYGYTMCYEEDVDVCGREASEVIEIKNLNEKAIQEYWEEARRKEFNDLFHNCCRISAKALNHGFFWSTYSGIGTFFTRTGRIYGNFGDSVIHAYGMYFNQISTWTPYTVAGLAKYIKKIVE